ncbi:hypothetical protein [Bacillus seohaeanensis]|jgi:hypothetical protein|uniref:Uncharacterized protein n=1 Tax=Bacillus seohaeanensis TaxID=284580 RepID=A0ABW5RMY3_9BACI
MKVLFHLKFQFSILEDELLLPIMVEEVNCNNKVATNLDLY